MKKWVMLGALVVAIGCYFWSNRAVTLGPGIKAPNEPVQVRLVDPLMIRHQEYSLMPLASFEIEAKVLGTERYWLDRTADIAPVDLALGWGRMSDERILESIDISQTGRWYKWKCKKPPIPVEEIKASSANMHIIPASKEVEKALKSVRRGHIVSIKGDLVRVTGDDGTRWKSSLSRTDTGAGACEIIYAREFTIRPVKTK